MDVLDLLAVAVGCFAIAHLFLPTPAWGNLLRGLLIQAAMAYLLILAGLEYLGDGTVTSPARPISFWVGIALVLVQGVHLGLSLPFKKIGRRAR